jgi:nucleoside-diphosphate-sugar epimerase
MNVLLTGGSGYIGSVLTPGLIADGHRVTIMDLVPPITGEWLKRDVFSEPVSAADLRDFDAVIHLAALVGDEICHEKPGNAVEVNFLATKYLAKACREAGKRLIFASTCSVYGVKQGLSDETTDPEPYSVYGLTKLKAEEDVLRAGGVVFRLATVYGISPKMSYILVINEFVRAAKTGRPITVFGGGQFRPFLNINNAARAFRTILKTDVRREIINISDENITLGELGKTVAEIYGGTVKYIPEMVDRRSYRADNSKAIGVLGFKPQQLAEGIRAMQALVL